MLVTVTEAVDWAGNMSGKGLNTDRLSLDWAEMMRFNRTFTDKMPSAIVCGFEKAGIIPLHGDAVFLPRRRLGGIFHHLCVLFKYRVEVEIFAQTRGLVA